MNGNSYGSPYGNGYYPQQHPQQPSMIWVSCEQEARSYMVAPNVGVALWDSGAPRVYLKQADASGRPSFRVFDLVERTDGLASPSTAQQETGAAYVTRKEFEELAAAVREIKGRKKKKIEEDDDDE